MYYIFNKNYIHKIFLKIHTDYKYQYKSLKRIRSIKIKRVL